jgi:integrase
MSLHKRGDVWHFDFQLGRHRFRGTTGETAKKKAEAVEADKRAEAKRALQLGGRVERAPLTLRQVADKWFAAQIRGKKTARTTAMRLKTLFRHIDGDMPAREVGGQEVADAILSRRVEPIRQSPKHGEPRYPSNATVNRDLIDSTLRPILNYAEDPLGEPIKRIKWAKLRLKEPKGRTRNFTAEELGAWRSELPAWHQPVFDFMARYGVRLDEAFFPPSAVNVEACEVTLHDTKNGTDHALQIHDDDMPDLAARKARAQAAKLDTIWFKDEGGELSPIHWRGFQSASRAALDRAKVANARPAHDLRHHAATTLYRATGNIKLVQDLLNHQSIASSARYAHTNKADLRRALSETYAPTKAAEGE